MVLCLGETPVRFLCCCCSFLMCIFLCRCFSFCCCIFIWFPGYFTTSSALYPGFSDPWRPLPALSSTPTTFDYLFFFIYCERYGFECAFFTHRRFLPHAPSQHFWHNLLLSRLPWEPAVIPWNFRALCWSSKHRSRPSVCLIHSNPQFVIYLKFVFIHVNIAKILLVVKTLIRSAAALFKSHENIKQQPN